MGHRIKHKAKEKGKEKLNEVQEQEYNDQFVEIANEALDKAVSYKYWILGLVLVSLIAAASYSIYKSRKEANIVQTSKAFLKANSILSEEIVDNSKAENKFKNNNEKLEAAIEEFKNFNKNNSSTLNKIANLQIANSYYELAKYEEALKYYDLFLKDCEDSMKGVVILKKGIILKEMKKFDEALKVLNKNLKSENSYVSAASLFQSAEIYGIKKDEKNEKAFLQRIVDEHANMPFFVQKAKNKL